MNYIFTFGTGHLDCEGRSLGNSYVVIPGRNLEEARAVMLLLRGQKWSHCYDSEEAAGVYRFNLSCETLDRICLPESEAPRPFKSVMFTDKESSDVA